VSAKPEGQPGNAVVGAAEAGLAAKPSAERLTSSTGPWPQSGCPWRE
jgi:hypothetical protein